MRLSVGCIETHRNHLPKSASSPSIFTLSLMAVQLRTRLEQIIGQPVSPAVVFNHPSVKALSEFVVAQVEARLGDPAKGEGAGSDQGSPVTSGSTGAEPGSKALPTEEGAGSEVRQLLDAEAACRLAVYLHGAAGDLAEADEGELSMTAADLADHLGDAVRSVGIEGVAQAGGAQDEADGEKQGEKHSEKHGEKHGEAPDQKRTIVQEITRTTVRNSIHIPPGDQTYSKE
jgi:hypothetical protein